MHGNVKNALNTKGKINNSEFGVRNSECKGVKKHWFLYTLFYSIGKIKTREYILHIVRARLG